MTETESGKETQRDTGDGRGVSSCAGGELLTQRGSPGLLSALPGPHLSGCLPLTVCLFLTALRVVFNWPRGRGCCSHCLPHSWHRHLAPHGDGTALGGSHWRLGLNCEEAVVLGQEVDSAVLFRLSPTTVMVVRMLPPVQGLCLGWGRCLVLFAPPPAPPVDSGTTCLGRGPLFGLSSCIDHFPRS